MAELFTDESALLTALKNGDQAALETLFRTYYEGLCKYAHTILNDMDESEETVQQLFIQLWEKRSSMKISNSAQAYLQKAVRNSCLNKIKHKKVRRQYVEEATALANHSEPSTSISLQNELRDQINIAIESLPEQCRIIFKLSRFEELKYSEIAEQMGLSIKTVENQMGKALRIMREKLKDYLVILIMLTPYYF
ncbi:MAG: RNA polymerase sigma-70 factor [Bacteroidetes bacterium]|nr:MAG: RNA polymerase sigma-70 factor [Bacteroidota bacterium]